MAFKQAAKRVLPESFLPILRALRYQVWLGLEIVPQYVPPRAIWEMLEFTKTDAIDAIFLIGTSTGLLIYDRGEVHRILDGFTYGITRCAERWYIFRKHVTGHTQRAIGQIVSFALSNCHPQDLRIEINGLDDSVHQIDIWERHLHIADTAHNRIIRFKITARGLKNREDFHPNGKLDDGEQSVNYVHLNSLYAHDGEIYCVYHNMTSKTDRKSQLAILSRSFAMERTLDLDAGDAHNIAVGACGLMYCDSRSGEFILGDTAFPCGCFTRGLACTDDLVFVGGSDFAERDKRAQSTGYVFVFNIKTREEAGLIKLPGVGSVYEIRLVEPCDRGMSSFTT